MKRKVYKFSGFYKCCAIFSENIFFWYSNATTPTMIVDTKS